MNFAATWTRQVADVEDVPPKNYCKPICHQKTLTQNF